MRDETALRFPALCTKQAGKTANLTEQVYTRLKGRNSTKLRIGAAADAMGA